MNNHSSISQLVEGYKQFKLNNFERQQTFQDLVEYGQKPSTLLIACCDSRVDPAIVLGAKPGELFVVRNVANLVPPYMADPRHHGTSAALEFGIKGLKVDNIILFGHSHCGGIKALMEGAQNQTTDFISAWMNIAMPAKERVLEKHPQATLEEQCQECEKESLITSLNNLHSFGWIQEKIAEGSLLLHAWYFDLRTGVIQKYNGDAFVELID